MKTCPFCAASLAEEPPCSHCGWSRDQLPREPIAWEKTPYFVLNVAWIRTLYQLFFSPREFFRALAHQKKSWRPWSFGIPLLLLMVFMAIMILPKVMGTLSQEAPVDWDLFFQTFVVPLMELSVISRAGHVAFFLLEASAFWFLFVAAVTSLLHLGVYASGGLRVDWFRSFGMTGYALTPLLVVIVLSQMFLCLNPAIGFSLDGMLPQVVGKFFENLMRILMILWPYFITLIALEEVHRINRFRAQIVVLVSVFFGFFVLMLSGQLFGA